MKRGRKLRAEELDLWQQVARQVSPLGRSSTFVQKPAKPETAHRTPTKSPEPLPLPKMSGGKTPLKDDLAPSLAHSLNRQHVQMDQKAFKRMRRGRVQPDGKIDLHGMTLDRAHTALVRFVMRQHASGKRLLLVITGKGKSRADEGPIPVRLGVLRHQVPEWLRLPPLADVVLQVTQAHVSHGGEGAYYVYLRKAR